MQSYKKDLKKRLNVKIFGIKLTKDEKSLIKKADKMINDKS